MTRQARILIFLAGVALLAGLAAGACAGRGEPDPAYLESLRAMTASQLLHEHKALRAEEEALATRLAEARAGDLPPTAREAAQRSLDDSLRTVQAKRRAVDHILASGGYARSEIRYPVQQLVLRAEPPADAAPAEDSPQAPEPERNAPATAQPATKPTTGAPPAPKATSPLAAQGQPAPEAKAPAAPASPIPRAAANQAPPAPKTAPASPAPPTPAVAGQAQVLGVETARTPQGLEVRVRLSGKPGQTFFTMAGPPRIVLDITGVAEPRFRLFHRTLGAVEAKALRLGWHNAKAMLRLVLDTDAGHLGKAVVEETPDGLVLRVAP